MSPAQNFSPLFIGEITSTIAWRERRRREEVISVPSSSGKSLQPVERSTLDSSCDSISVPSSSGKSLQPATWYKIGTWSSEFQSPLHRGNHFNPCGFGFLFFLLHDFSPLFIGEITSTTPIQLDALRLLLFQSPLHRGNHFNRISNSTTGRRFPDFSPLFIGEITSTRSLRLPRSSGSEISVPSSSGKSLQPDSALGGNARKVTFQSPLHRGNHFNQIHPSSRYSS